MKDIKFFQDLSCENYYKMHSTLTSPPARQIRYQLNNFNSTATAYWSTLLSKNESMRCCHRHGVAHDFHVRQGQQQTQKNLRKNFYLPLKQTNQKFLHFFSQSPSILLFSCLLSFFSTSSESKKSFASCLQIFAFELASNALERQHRIKAQKRN